MNIPDDLNCRFSEIFYLSVFPSLQDELAAIGTNY